MFEMVHIFGTKDSDRIERFKIIHVPSKKMILFIGGFNGHQNRFLDTIQSYSTITNKWTTLNIKLPQEMHAFSHAITKNDQYILLFGGMNYGYDTDDMFVIDLNGMWIKKSKIKCPIHSNKFSSIIMNDNLKQKLLTNGFVRMCYKDKSFNTVKELPYYLIELIDTFYSNEWVHLMESPVLYAWEDFGQHWKMSVDDIINNCER